MLRQWTWHWKPNDWQAGGRIRTGGGCSKSGLSYLVCEIYIDWCHDFSVFDDGNYYYDKIYYYLMITMMLSNMLYGFLMYPNKPKASSMKPISRTNILVKTMLLISNTSVNSSGWGERRKWQSERKEEREGDKKRRKKDKERKSKLKSPLYYPWAVKPVWSWCPALRHYQSSSELQSGPINQMGPTAPIHHCWSTPLTSEHSQWSSMM